MPLNVGGRRTKVRESFDVTDVVQVRRWEAGCERDVAYSKERSV